MNTPRLVVLGLAPVAARGAAFLARGLLGGGTPKFDAKLGPPSIAMSRVLVASNDLQPDQSLSPALVRWQKWPAASVELTFVVETPGIGIDAAVKGTVVRAPMVAGEPVTAAKIVHADTAGFMAAMLATGMRAVSITITTDSGAGGFILPNDRVDLILTQKNNDNPPRARAILHDIRVLAINPTAAQDKNRKAVLGKTATLELTPAQALQVASAEQEGALALSLRALDDSNPAAALANAMPDFCSDSENGGEAANIAIIRYGVTQPPSRQRPEARTMMRTRFPFGGLAAAFLALAPLFLTFATPSSAAIDEAAARVVPISTHGVDTIHQRITLSLDKAAIVQLDADARDVLVSNPEIVNAVVRTPRRIFLLASKTGQTNAFFFDGAGHQILSLDIRVEKDVTDLANMMKSDLPESAITVSALNDNVVLSGTVSSALESTHAQDLAASFTGDPKKVINMLKVAGGEQVMLKVRVAEMDRNIAKQFGINLTGQTVSDGVPLVLSTSNPFGLLGAALSDVSGTQVGGLCGATPLPVGVTIPCSNTSGAQSVMQALEQVGLVHMLAEPNLTAVSGETAKFLAGGEFPVPVAKDNQGNVSLEFKEFGVGLSFTPVVINPGRISLQIATEVSELTNTGAFNLQGGSTTVNGITTVTQGVSVPALSVRKAQTTIELPSGGSFAIAGLMQHETKQVIDGFPGLKDMPVLGALFRSRDFENNETELVVVVSAYMVEPTTDKAFAAPTDGFIAASDPETLLLGRLNAVYRKSTNPIQPQANASVGFIVR